MKHSKILIKSLPKSGNEKFKKAIKKKKKIDTDNPNYVDNYTNC